MPSAAPDDAFVGRFKADLERLLTAERLPADLRLTDLRLGVALSGGPDSVALLLLAAAAAPGRTFAMTVDHGLRASARAEAEAAAALCASIGVPHDVYRVVVEDRASLQAAARDSRYGALDNWADREGIPVVMTAHHADDQAETLLMRLSRGAGVGGLAGIRAHRSLGPTTTLLRPLLGWRKAELEAIVAAAGIVPARDPSNEDPRYDRTAARALLAETDWIDPRRLAASASHLADAEDALAQITRQRTVDAIADDGEGALFRRTGIREIDRRLLLHMFAERFGKHPEGPALERMIEALHHGETVTLADILCRSTLGEWRFRPAPPRRS